MSIESERSKITDKVVEVKPIDLTNILTKPRVEISGNVNGTSCERNVRSPFRRDSKSKRQNSKQTDDIDLYRLRLREKKYFNKSSLGYRIFKIVEDLSEYFVTRSDLHPVKRSSYS